MRIINIDSAVYQSRGAAGEFQSTPSLIPQRYESEAAGGTHFAPVLVGDKAPRFARPFQASALTPTVRRSLQAFTAGRLTPKSNNVPRVDVCSRVRERAEGRASASGSAA